MNIFRAGNGLEVLSPQQLVDCDSNNGVKRLNLNGLRMGFKNIFPRVVTVETRELLSATL